MGDVEKKSKGSIIFRDTLFILLGIGCAAFGLKGFLMANHFIDGGITGISLLLSLTTPLPLALYLVVLNLPFVFMGTKIVSKSFSIKTALAITGLSLAVTFIHFPQVTNDNLLIAIFGGALIGAGIGFSIRGGAVLDGTEVLAIYVSKKIGATLGDVITLINVFIFSLGAYLLDIEVAMYSLITYLAASKTLDFIVEGIEEYVGVTIISSKSEEIRDMIIGRMGRGVTIYNGRRGLYKNGEPAEVEIIYTVVTRLELNKLNAEILEVDAKAFVVMSSVKDTKGGLIKKRPLH